MRKLLIGMLFLNTITLVWSQDLQTLTRLIIEKDSIFWSGYNTCNMENMKAYLADDVEFYHDKGGLMSGKDQVIEATKKNIWKSGQ